MTAPKRQGEGALSDAIREALAFEPGLLLFRNAQCAVVKSNRMVRGGLGNGSADLVGVLGPLGSTMPLGLFVALEVKRPGEIPERDRIDRIIAKAPSSRSKDEERDLAQHLWLCDVRGRGGFAAYVDSVQSARDAIARARRGATQ